METDDSNRATVSTANGTAERAAKRAAHFPAIGSANSYSYVRPVARGLYKANINLPPESSICTEGAMSFHLLARDTIPLNLDF